MGQAQLRILKEQGVEAWNEWRRKNRVVWPDLSGAELSGAELSGADLRDANLSNANLVGAQLHRVERHPRFFEPGLRRKYKGRVIAANLSGAKLRGANLVNAACHQVDFSEADLSEADLHEADLSSANLSKAKLFKADLRYAQLRAANLSNSNLREADLSGANLIGSALIRADLSDADLTGCHIFGVSAWQLTLSKGTKQRNLVITEVDEPQITADDIEVAQFLYLLIHNEKLRKVIDTITSKVVLILGRFSEERKVVLDAVRDALRKRDLLPVIFDFAIPASRDVTETVKVLAGLARFVIADITDATEVRVELHNIARDFPSLAVQPILLRGQPEFVRDRKSVV
jgi:uncharacterized protein YjbI with pentapeptide repeats